MGSYLLSVGSEVEADAVGLVSRVLAQWNASIDDLALRVVREYAPLTVSFSTAHPLDLDALERELLTAFRRGGSGVPGWLVVIPLIREVPRTRPEPTWVATFEITEDAGGIVERLTSWLGDAKLQVLSFNARAVSGSTKAWIILHLRPDRSGQYRSPWDLGRDIRARLESSLPGRCRLVEMSEAYLPEAGTTARSETA